MKPPKTPIADELITAARNSVTAARIHRADALTRLMKIASVVARPGYTALDQHDFALAQAGFFDADTDHANKRDAYYYLLSQEGNNRLTPLLRNLLLRLLIRFYLHRPRRFLIRLKRHLPPTTPNSPC